MQHQGQRETVGEALEDDGPAVEVAPSPQARRPDARGGPTRDAQRPQTHSQFDALSGLSEDPVDLAERIALLKR